MRTYTTECHCAEGHIAATCFMHNALWLLEVVAEHINAMVDRESISTMIDEEDTVKLCKAFDETITPLMGCPIWKEDL